MLKVSRSGFYGYLCQPETRRDKRDAVLVIKTRAVFNEHKGRYGSPRVHRELRHRGETISEKKVARLMREDGLVARRAAAGLVLHSDRESPYSSDDYRRELHRTGAVASVS